MDSLEQMWSNARILIQMGKSNEALFLLERLAADGGYTYFEKLVIFIGKVKTE